MEVWSLLCEFVLFLLGTSPVGHMPNNERKDVSLVKYWHIHFENGLVIECFRRHKPVRLAQAYSRKRATNGTYYGSYMIVGG